MDDWRQKIQRSLRDSQLFLAVLSPNYLKSPYCRWEWEDYVRYEAMRQCLSEGVAPVFFVTLPDAADLKTDQALARWIDEIQRRQTFDLRPWHDAGEEALEQAHVKEALKELNESVRKRLNRSNLASKSQNNLIKHNPAFIGRMHELTELRNALTKNKLGVVGACEGQMPGRATVQGLGGMGKTELALAYAHAFAWDYPGGRWRIPCEHVGDLRVALLHLANANALNFEFTEDEKKNLALAFERVLRELNRRERCLLILDNVSDPNLLQPEYLDRLPRDGWVDLIATTRLAPRAIPGSVQEQTFIAVDELPEEDALALMRNHQREGRFATQQEDDEARAIVRLLRGFTLAVETAAIYLGRDTTSDGCRRFRERLSPDLLRESEIAATDVTVAVRHRVRSLEETLAFTLQALTPVALHLLEIASLLPADQIALPWLKTVGAEAIPTLTAARDEPNCEFRQAAELLLGLRLIQSGGVVDNDGRLLVARMHRLVQELLRHKSKQEDLVAKRQRFIELSTLRISTLEKATSWDEARWEMEPLDAVAHQWAGDEVPNVAWFCNQVAVFWHTLGNWSRAETLMRRVLAIDEQHFGQNHPVVASDLFNLAELLRETDRLDEAEVLLRRMLLIDEQSLSPSDQDVATHLNAMGQLLQDTDRLVEAESVYRRALAIDEESLGKDHPHVARDLNNLATLQHDTNRLAEAESLYERALAIKERAYGPRHPEVAISLNNLGLLRENMNRPGEAEPLLRRALSIDESAFGPDHPSVARDLGNVALVLQSINRLAEAETLVQRALAIDERSFGQDHPSVALRLNNLVALLLAQGRVVEAEPLMQRALRMLERSRGPNHPDVARALSNLAQTFKTTGRTAEAEPLMRRVIQILESCLDPDDVDLAIAFNNLAMLLKATGRPAEAERLFRRAVVTLIKFQIRTAQKHPHLRTVMMEYALSEQESNSSPQDMFDELHEAGERALAIFLEELEDIID